MSNGREINNKLDFKESIKGMGGRELQEFTAELIYDHSEAQKDYDQRITKNYKMIWQNRYMIIGLIILLIALGILDASVMGLVP